jgi:hypothetical protein
MVVANRLLLWATPHLKAHLEVGWRHRAIVIGCLAAQINVVGGRPSQALVGGIGLELFVIQLNQQLSQHQDLPHTFLCADPDSSYLEGDDNHNIKDNGMDAEQDINPAGAKRTSEVREVKKWTDYKRAKADKFRGKRLELYVKRASRRLDLFTGEEVPEAEDPPEANAA